MRMMLIGVVIAAGCDGGSASPDAPPSDAAPREVVMDDKALLVGELGEATLTGGPGDRAVITLSAPVAKLDWNLHGHANGSTQVVKEELGIMSTTYTFTPTAQAEWFLLVRNADTAPITVGVHIELYGDIVWSGWQ